MFWNECKCFFFNKHARGDSKITLFEKEKNSNNSNKVTKNKTLLVNNIMKSLKPLIKLLHKS